LPSAERRNGRLWQLLTRRRAGITATGTSERWEYTESRMLLIAFSCSALTMLYGVTWSGFSPGQLSRASE
jgi:hypothetical protein